MLDGAVKGAEEVRSIVVAIRTLYGDSQEFHSVGPWGDDGFIEDYVARVSGKPLGCVNLVIRNAAGQTQHVVASYRPRSTVLLFSRLLAEKFAGTDIAEHFLGQRVLKRTHHAGAYCNPTSTQAITSPEEVLMNSAAPQAPGLTRTEIQQHDLSVPGRAKSIQNRVQDQPCNAVFRHKHPGEEVIYVLEGLLEYDIDGQPPTRVSPGEGLTVPAETVHAARNVGNGDAAELATYFVEKGSRSSWQSNEVRRVGPAPVVEAAVFRLHASSSAPFCPPAIRDVRSRGLARDGRHSNPEIGGRLLLSPRTVEWHLGKVFTKLGISSRRELAPALPAAESALASV